MDSFEGLEEALRSGGAASVFDFLMETFRGEKKYPLLFEARLMHKRHELDLPLVQTGPIGDLPAEKRPAYEKAFIEAAREVGSLFLADGDIPRAWSYFRAIGEPAPVAAAIERLQPGEGLEAALEIAFHEGVNPRKGFELILATYGTCRAITAYQQYPTRAGRDESLRLLVRTLHTDLVAALKRSITEAEGSAPDTDDVCLLITGRDWLFGEFSYYVDTSHLCSVLQFSLELEDRDTLRLALELAEYGQRLSPMFHHRGDPPFEDLYVDHATYLRALLGERVDEAIAHFTRKAECDPQQVGPAPAQVLVGLLARLDRYQEAIDAAARHLAGFDPAQLACPSIPELCQAARDFDRLRQIARRRGDLLHFAAGLLAAPLPAAR